MVSARSILGGLTAWFVLAALAATPALAQTDAPQSSPSPLEGEGQGEGVENSVVEFDIDAQPLSSALIQLSQQAGVQVVMEGERANGTNVGALRGEYAVKDALELLLLGTGFTADQTGPLTYTVKTPQGATTAGQNTVGQRRAGIEEIIVTGQKREERIQDVPIAISAFTMEDLKTSQIAGGPDLHLQVPNMTFTKTNFTGYSIQIRGIGTQAISATTDPAVAVALNQTPFIRNRFFEQEFYDLERVEVLRGPQGTLFGRNATAGVVNLITAKPKFQKESMVSLDMGNYNSRRWEFMVNTPLVEDEMALRIAAAGTKRDGYATNEITGNPIDGRDLWSSRVSLRFAPANGNFDVNLIWEHFEEDDDRLRSGKQLCKKDIVTEVGDLPVSYYQGVPDRGQVGAIISNVQSVFSQGCERNSLYAEDSFQTPNGMSIPYYYQVGSIGLPRALQDPYVSALQSNDLRVIESALDPEYRAESDIGELQISVDLTDGLTLDSETAYMVDSIYSLQDFNRFNTARGAWLQPEDAGARPGLLEEGPEGGIFCDPQLGCSDRLVAVDVSTAESEQFSQELRLSSQFGGPFNFSLGANFLRYDTEDKYYVFINSLTMTAANRGSTPYVPHEADNTGCLGNWLLPGNPNTVYGVTGCTYIDPNPIESVNDKGHNYFLSRNPYELTSYAAFGEAYYNIADNLKLTAGLRWSVDKKEAPRIPTWLLASQSVGLPVAETIEQTWREPTGRLVLDWKPNLSFTDETLLYGSYSRGYKAGGANPPTFVYTFFGSSGGITQVLREASATRPRTFDAEFVDAFEIGTKNTFADGAVTMNAAAFYYDYTGYQISEIVDRSAFNRNFDVEVWGAELEADWWVAENLRLGFKGGYQKTRLRDGERAVDLMDRTAGGNQFLRTNTLNPNYTGAPGEGRPISEYVTGIPLEGLPEDQEFYAFDEWTVVRPFPTYASNCVLPTQLYMPPREEGAPGGGLSGPILGLGGPNGGQPGGCEHAYILGNDPVTESPYEPFPTGGGALGFWEANGTDYPGYDPSIAPNNGEGFYKDIGGNELPNAPNYTATITADYVVPLKGNWLATLHTDLYWQSESWWRVFNDHEYNRLDDYFTMNLAAIFTNEVSGWDIMAYVKNVTDEDALTGAFLFSDDTGLATNAFLVEPRLYGVRVTKHWDGGGPAQWLSGAGSALIGKRAGEPSPFSLTLGGQLVRYDSAYEDLNPTFSDAFASPLDAFGKPQNQDLDWGDGREIELAYRPDDSPWTYSLGYRAGKANGDEHLQVTSETDPNCLFGGVFIVLCDPDNPFWANIDESQKLFITATATNWLEVEVSGREQHQLIDVAMSRELPAFGLERSAFGVGLRYARFESETAGHFFGIPDWNLPPGSFIPFGSEEPELAGHTRHDARYNAEREFEGLGPVVSWEAGYALFEQGNSGLDLEWTVSTGLLFGRQETEIAGIEETAIVDLEAGYAANETDVGYTIQDLQDPPDRTIVHHERDNGSVEVVPVLGGELGLTYRIGGGSVSAGYRWERYYSAIDGGFEERKLYDRTIDGPYFKVTFGGGK